MALRAVLQTPPGASSSRRPGSTPSPRSSAASRRSSSPPSCACLALLPLFVITCVDSSAATMLHLVQGSAASSQLLMPSHAQAAPPALRRDTSAFCRMSAGSLATSRCHLSAASCWRKEQVHAHAACRVFADIPVRHPARRLYLSSDQFVYNPYYLVSNSPMQTSLGDARLRDAGLSFYRKNGKVNITGPSYCCVSVSVIERGGTRPRAEGNVTAWHPARMLSQRKRLWAILYWLQAPRMLSRPSATVQHARTGTDASHTVPPSSRRSTRRTSRARPRTWASPTVTWTRR